MTCRRCGGQVTYPVATTDADEQIAQTITVLSSRSGVVPIEICVAALIRDIRDELRAIRESMAPKKSGKG